MTEIILKHWYSEFKKVEIDFPFYRKVQTDQSLTLTRIDEGFVETQIGRYGNIKEKDYISYDFSFSKEMENSEIVGTRDDYIEFLGLEKYACTKEEFDDLLEEVIRVLCFARITTPFEKS